MRFCTSHGKHMPVKQFYHQEGKPHGYICKECLSVRERARKQGRSTPPQDALESAIALHASSG